MLQSLYFLFFLYLFISISVIIIWHNFKVDTYVLFV